MSEEEEERARAAKEPGPAAASGGEGARDVDAGRAEEWVREGSVRCLDVRTPREFVELGHIPGALLLPVNLLPSAVAGLPRDGRPLLVICEHGIRSAFAADVLARAGLDPVWNLRGGMSEWMGPRVHDPASPFGSHGPSSWIVANADLLPPAGRALDVACGSGRNAMLLAAAGLEVRAVDRDAAQIATLERLAARMGWRVDAAVENVEAEGVSLGEEAFDIVLVFRFLHRPLFPALIRALRPGGVLFYETFTRAQALRGKPTNPNFLLEPGELIERVAPLEVVRQREGEYDGGMVSAVVARKG
jgi:tellurite methyltransferase